MPLWLAVLLLVLALAVPETARRISVLRKRPRVVVVTKTGRTFDGVLIKRSLVRLVLADAFVLVGSGGRVACDGLVWLDRANVEWVQVAV